MTNLVNLCVELLLVFKIRYLTAKEFLSDFMRSYP